MTTIASMFILPKRGREEDEGELDEIRNDRKKPRTLPFRTSPTTKHTSLFSQSRQLPRAPVLTPAESSEDDSDSAYSSRGHKLPSHLLTASLTPADNFDLEMEDSQALGSPLWSPRRLPGSPANSPTCRITPSLASRAVSQVQQLSISSTRIPTPIYGYFQVSPQDATMSTPTSTTSSEPIPKLTTLHEDQHDIFMRRRRLPSPISEDEDMESPTTMTGCMLRKLDMSATTAPHYLTDVDMMTPVTPDANLFLGSGWRDKRRGAIDGRVKDIKEVECGTQGKVVFSMGFRADCDKCKSRVPGHYSHVLRV